MTVIVSDTPKDYNSFLMEIANTLDQNPPKGMAVVSICEDGNTVCGYWNMSLKDKITAEAHLRFDVMDEFIKNNIDRYKEGD